MSDAGIEDRMGRKWRATEVLEVVESQLRQKELVARGLGYFPRN